MQSFLPHIWRTPERELLRIFKKTGMKHEAAQGPGRAGEGCTLADQLS